MGVAAGVPEALVAFETGEALCARSLVAAEHRLAAALVGFGSSNPWGLDGRALLSVASDLRGHVTHAVALGERTGNVGRALARADERDTVNDRVAAAYIAAATGRLSPAAAAEYARTGDLAPATAYIEAGRAALRADQLAHLEALAAGLLLFAQSAQSVADAVSLVGNITSLAKLAGSTVLHRIAARRGAEAAARLLESAGTLPAGFVSAGDFIAFSDSARMGLVRAGYEDATAILQGSAVTGRSFRTSEAFDVGRLSDFDLAIASPTALQRATALGMPLRSGGVRTGARQLAARGARTQGTRGFSLGRGGPAGEVHAVRVHRHRSRPCSEHHPPMSPTRYDLYGSRDGNIDDVASTVAATLGIRFEARESSYIGEYFRAVRADGVEILVQENFADEEGELIEQAFPQHRTLVYVNDAAPDVGARLAAIAGLELLRSQEV